jgi:hypothetical protein
MSLYPITVNDWTMRGSEFYQKSSFHGSLVTDFLAWADAFSHCHNGEVSVPGFLY